MAYASITTTASVTTSTVVVNKPASCAVGDLLVAGAFYGTDGGTITIPTGFTTWKNTNVVVDNNAVICYRIVDGTEGSSFTFSHTASTANTAAWCVRITPEGSSPPDILTAPAWSSAAAVAVDISGVSDTDLYPINDFIGIAKNANTAGTPSWETFTQAASFADGSADNEHSISYYQQLSAVTLPSETATFTGGGNSTAGIIMTIRWLPTGSKQLFFGSNF